MEEKEKNCCSEDCSCSENLIKINKKNNCRISIWNDNCIDEIFMSLKEYRSK